jgi:hypothetical protein
MMLNHKEDAFDTALPTDGSATAEPLLVFTAIVDLLSPVGQDIGQLVVLNPEIRGPFGIIKKSDFVRADWERALCS